MTDFPENHADVVQKPETAAEDPPRAPEDPPEDSSSPSPPDYIPPVSQTALEESKSEGDLDPGARVLVEQEKAYVDAWRAKHARTSSDGDLTGLAISGGGIRSAIFALGVMQALAKGDLLKRFDYLSTVSGGGYIGSSLTWLLSRNKGGDGEPRFGVGPKDFPYGTDDPGESAMSRTDSVEQRALLSYLRTHGKYLAPGGGISVFSMLAGVARAVFLNLLVNAAQAIEKYGTITVRSGQETDNIWVEVTDTGRGIPPENLKRIFEPFFTTKEVGKGTGLGLHLAYTIVQAHGGRIRAESTVGEGTTFHVELPIAGPVAVEEKQHECVG